MNRQLTGGGAYGQQLPDPFRVDWGELLIGLRQLSRRARLILMSIVIVFANVAGLFLPMQSHASGADMLLFWDPSNASIPTGWSAVTSINGTSIANLFPRGESTANFGTTGGSGSRPFTPGIASETVSGPTGAAQSNGGDATSGASTTHAHPVPTTTIGTDNNGDGSNPDVPVFKNLELIVYGSITSGNLVPGSVTSGGIPNIIPNGAIAIFNSTTMPTNFTRYSAQDNKMVRLSTSSGSGGGDTITNTVTFTGGLVASTDATIHTNNFLGGHNAFAAATNHTHTLTNGTTASVNADPPYVQPILGQATQNTPTISLNVMTMFDADPGVGWTVLSNSGGPYNQQFLRPNNTPSYTTTSTGAATHTDPTFTSAASGTASAQIATFTLIAGTLIDPSHTHTVQVTFNSVSNLPPFVDVVIAQKVSFTLTSFQWYADTTSLNETDTWPAGTLGVAPHTQIPAIPAPYGPPIDSQQLRIRVQIQVSGQALAINTLSFKLQYNQGTATDCISGSWQDVDDYASSHSRIWRYGNEAGLTDGTQVTGNLLTSTDLENFYESPTTGAGFTNPAAAATGDTMEYDWVVQDHGATGGSQYNFRVVENQGTLDNGTLLSVYNFCPSVITMPTTDQLLRHGEFFQDGQDKGFEWAN